MRALSYLLAAITVAFSGIFEHAESTVGVAATKVVAGNNEFAFDLYHVLRSRPDNLFFSPFIISTALAMTYAGARGATADEIASTMHFPSAETLAAYAGLLDELGGRDTTAYQLRIANRLWGDDGVKVREPFLRTTREQYGAEMETIDFTEGEDARRKINRWVMEMTNDKIEDVVPPGALHEWTRLVLTNAIYFNAPWENPFENAETRDLPFHVSASAQVDVPTMTRTERFAFARVAGLSLIELPYQDGQVVMVILLPDRTDGLEDLESRLSSAQLEKWLAALKRTNVEVFLPRFRMTAALDLIPSMKALGMRSAFSAGEADFSGIDGGRDTLYIDLIAHKAYVDVNERGTEAAAATAEALRALGYMKSGAPPVFRADHPFLFLIRDVRTGTILFLGRVVDPSRA